MYELWVAQDAARAKPTVDSKKCSIQLTGIVDVDAKQIAMKHINSQ